MDPHLWNRFLLEKKKQAGLYFVLKWVCLRLNIEVYFEPIQIHCLELSLWCHSVYQHISKQLEWEDDLA